MLWQEEFNCTFLHASASVFYSSYDQLGSENQAFLAFVMLALALE